MEIIKKFSLENNIDPRIYQIIILSTLLLYGLFFLKFELVFWQILATFVAALGMQYLMSKLLDLNKIEYKSAVITSLSLCLLLKTFNPLVAVFAAIVAIVSKFFLRWKGKHIFNPANLGLITAVLITQQAWISPGQWGSVAAFAFFIACIGGMVVFKSLRSDIALVFLFSYLGLLVVRTLWLGDPWAIFFHQVQNGALLIFAFFMISDPKTSPNSRLGRILFACFIAIAAFILQYSFFVSNAPIWCLVVLALLVPIIDILFVGEKYDWETVKKETNVLSFAFVENEHRLVKV